MADDTPHPAPVRLLLIEDESGYAGMVQHTLDSADESFDITWVPSLGEAIAQLKIASFDAAILDLTLPDSEGVATVARLRPVAPRLPIVVLSGLDDEAIIYDVLSRGVQDYLIKDTSATVLLPRAIRYAIESKRMDIQLRETVDRLEGLFKQSPDAIFVESNEGIILDVNPAACRLHHMSREELVGKHVLELVPVERREAVRKRFHEWLSCEMQRFEGFSRTSDGEDVPVEIRGARISYNGEPALLLHVRDISERRESEAALAESQQRFRDLADLIPLPLWETDLDGNFTYTNRAGYETFGYAEADVERGLHALTVFARKDRIRMTKEFLARLADKTYESQEYTCVTSEGRTFPVLMYSAPILQDGEVIGLRGITLDIEDRVALERQLRQTEKHESLGTLAKGVAREISNPVMGIIGYADLLKDFFKEDDEGTDFIGEIIRNARGISNLTRDLLRFSPPDMIDSWDRLQVTEVVNNTASLVRSSLEESGITLSTELGVAPPLVHGNEQQIQQLLMHLITNSQDALNEQDPPSTADKRITVTVRPLSDDEWQPAQSPSEPAGHTTGVRITVEDNGPGVSEHTQERIFDPFFSTKPRDEGTGLGLSISHSIVREHGGQITVESEQGAYTRIHIDLPIVTGV
ncbi:MAG: PAS domain S-box protein [Kiritimatiellia bacterium]|jgi:PAS domain S-box-containing protein|nr:PAS domain S-box protein [Kiritimatiellia bacterium]MDP6811390.1 PAS domain S-box protein [Kiritimatiellia bacterium]MDP7023814.1 PAS domain S-box protein [Kiritimatiellia bacterium]